MEISKESWLYKVAYGWTKKKPQQTNLCRFFWRFIIFLFFIWPIVYPCWKIIDWLIIRGIGGIIAFLIFGHQPVSWANKNKNGLPFQPVSWWAPGKDRLGPLSALALLLVILGMIAAIVYILYRMFSCVISYTIHTILHLTITSKIIFYPTLILFILLIIGIAVLMNWYKIERSGWWQVFRVVRAYLQAKKEKVCPIIRFQ